MEAAENLFKDLLIAYKEHRIDEAYTLKEKYIEEKFPIQDNQQDLFDTIQLEYDTMISFYNQFDQDGWVLDKEEKGVRL